MSVHEAGDDLATLLERARAQLAAARPQPAETSVDTAGTRGVGESESGTVRARMSDEGQLTELTLDAATSSMPRRELQRDIIEAVNAAWASSRGVDPADAAVANIDPALLAQRLAEVQEQGLRSMARITGGLQEAMRQIERDTRR